MSLIFSHVWKASSMYKTEKEQQLTFDGFNQSCGMKLYPKDELIILTDQINEAAVEVEYSALFKSKRGRLAVSSCQALGALIIQKRMKLCDHNLVKEISRYVVYQYFIGLQAYQTKCLFNHGVMPAFRKRSGKDLFVRVNEVFLKDAKTKPACVNEKKDPAANGNKGLMLLDTTCFPTNVRYPQDFSLLNGAREKPDGMIDLFHESHSGKHLPRTYRRGLRKKYPAMTKSKRRTAKQTRAIVFVMPCTMKRNIAFVNALLSAGGFLDKQWWKRLETIRKLYAQQKEMFDKNTHRVTDRIVRVSQPFIRPIVRDKVKTPVEFGAKYNVSVDEQGRTRLEHIAFNPYNESTILQSAVECYKQRTGHYPKRLLVDQVDQTKENRNFCEKYGIEMSGRKAVRPSSDEKERRNTEKKMRQNDIDCIDVERFFRIENRCCGAGVS